VLRQACCAFRNVFLKLFKVDRFREVIIIPYNCNKVFRTMLLKSDTVGTIPRAVYRMGIVSQLRVFNGWRILGGLAKLFMPVIGGKSIWWVPNVIVDG